jgi:hypothetical protein
VRPEIAIVGFGDLVVQLVQGNFDLRVNNFEVMREHH